MPREREPIVSAAFLTADPHYHTAKTMLAVLDILTSHKDYAPESINGGEGKVDHEPFTRQTARSLSETWERSRGLWDLKRRQPYGMTTIVKSASPFQPLMVHVEREFLKDSLHLSDFISLMKELYGAIHPAFGKSSLEEMVRVHLSPSGARSQIGTNLKRALPDIYWANFLGPEYVEFFGLERVLATPIHSVERLPDGGALLILSETPFDYLLDREAFDKKRLEVKKYLGIEAFDTGESSFNGKVPRFRFLDEKESERKNMFAYTRDSLKVHPDLLSKVGRNEWKNWICDSKSLAQQFTKDVKGEGIMLELSAKSLPELDHFLKSMRRSKVAPTTDFLKKLAAYVSEIIIKETGAGFVLDESEPLPYLQIGKIRISPLLKAERVLFENEGFASWYRFIAEERAK